MPLMINAITALSETIAARARDAARPFIIAIDGHSGAGKSTLTQALAAELDAVTIAGDDFYAGGIDLRDDDPAQRAAACIDWTRQRAVLEALRAERGATWRAFDWQAFDGRLCDAPITLAPKPIAILEGVYAARPELSDLLDMRILLSAPEGLRTARLLARERTIGPWDRQWHDAEEFYFERVVPAANFDVIYET